MANALKVASWGASALAVALAAVMAFPPGEHGSGAGEADARAPAIASGSASKDAGGGLAAATGATDAATGVGGELGLTGDLDGGLGGSLDLALEAPPAGKGPKRVRFGVVLVTYEGAEDAPPKGARSKGEAATFAAKLDEDAKTDFHAAVSHGDPGSMDDVGQVERGVLEPSSETALFALPVGGVSGVVDTPRGFWIVKRLE